MASPLYPKRQKRAGNSNKCDIPPRMAKTGGNTSKTTFREHPLDYILQVFADVEGGEAPTVLLLTLNVFILLCAYYFLKVAREPLILHKANGAEVKSYASAGQAVTLIFTTFAYGWLARHVDRMKLIAIVTLFFVGNLVLFWLAGISGLDISVPYYLWVGIYSLTVISQFWAFAADIYTEDQGKRLFPIVGVGGSLGSIAGAYLPQLVLPLGPYVLMLGSAVLLTLALGITFVVNRREVATHSNDEKAETKTKLGDSNGFALLVKDKYLLAIGALGFCLNWVNSNGEYILDRALKAASVANAAAANLTIDQYVESFKSHYFFIVNVVGFLLQLFVVSRVLKYLGLRGALFVMPAISLVGYGGISMMPVLSYIFLAKIAENSIDYSLQNTSLQALWLVVPRESKYKVKQITDAILVRFGDVASAGVVFAGSKLGFETRHFAIANIVIIAAWLATVWYIGKERTGRYEQNKLESAVAK
ncbi:MAG: translocase [Clostridia bacterium]|nr:translocase [Deltaproteobacteria bacterium]